MEALDGFRGRAVSLEVDLLVGNPFGHICLRRHYLPRRIYRSARPLGGGPGAFLLGALLGADGSSERRRFRHGLFASTCFPATHDFNDSQSPPRRPVPNVRSAQFSSRSIPLRRSTWKRPRFLWHKESTETAEESGLTIVGREQE